MSLVLGRTHPDVFGRIGALSPSVMWSGREIFRCGIAPRPLVQDLHGHGRTRTLLVLRYTPDYVEATTAFYRHLKGLGLGDHELRYRIIPGHFHNEEAWQARLPGSSALASKTLKAPDIRLQLHLLFTRLILLQDGSVSPGIYSWAVTPAPSYPSAVSSTVETAACICSRSGDLKRYA